MADVVERFPTRHPSGRRARFSLRSIATVGLFSTTAIAVGLLLDTPSTTRLAVAAVLVGVAAALAVRAHMVVLYVLPLWLVGLGTIRRLTTGLVGVGANLDPLLAVEPLVLTILAIVAVHYGALRDRSRLTTAVLALASILTLSALNPLQGSVRIGLTGAVVVVTPMLAFLVGRSLVNDQIFKRILIWVAGLAVPAALYGLYQVFGHFPSWDQRWIDQEKAFIALNVSGSIRPFGSFASGQEFGLYAAIGLILLLAFARRSRWLWMLAPIAVTGAAVWYESSRAIVVFVAFACALTAATRIGWPLRRSVLAGILILTALPWATGHVLPARFSGSTRGLQNHQAAGLADPFGNQSTLPFHVTIVTKGLKQAVSNPLGRGIGSVTSAAAKFGASAAGTELDASNAAVAGGALGLIAYIAVVALGFAGASEQALRRRDSLSLAAISLLAVTLLQWLNGGLYAVGWLPWLVLGWIDRPNSMWSNEVETAVG